MIAPVLADYGRILRSRWRWVAWGVVVATAVSAAVFLIVPPLYRTQTTIFVRTPGDVSQTQDGGNLYAQARAETYAALARSPGLSARVAADLGLEATPEKLAARVRGRQVGNTALFQVSVDAPTAGEARRTAEVLTAELTAQVATLESVPGSLLPRAELVVVGLPSDPRRVVAWGAPLYLVVMGVLLGGAVLGGCGAVLRQIVAGPDRKEEVG